MDRFVATQIKRLEAGKKPYLTRREKLQLKIEGLKASAQAQLDDLDAKIAAIDESIAAYKKANGIEDNPVTNVVFEDNTVEEAPAEGNSFLKFNLYK